MTITRDERDEPELELGESANERAELIRSASGEKGAAGAATIEGGIGEGGEEADEQIEDVDGEAVGDDVEALHEVDPEGVDGRDHAQGQPPGQDVRRVFVEDPLFPAGGGGDPGRDRRRRGAGTSSPPWGSVGPTEEGKILPQAFNMDAPPVKNKKRGGKERRVAETGRKGDGAAEVLRFLPP